MHYDGGSVRFGNDEPCYVKGKGCIALTNDLISNNSYWVEGPKYNLLSVAQVFSHEWKGQSIGWKRKSGWDWLYAP